jgi:peptidoglycan/xylan/chitin deacetylase (PgdA/CDA1 family)
MRKKKWPPAELILLVVVGFFWALTSLPIGKDTLLSPNDLGRVGTSVLRQPPIRHYFNFYEPTANLYQPVNKPAPRNLRVPILMYHHVGYSPANDRIRIGLTVSPADFHAQLGWLQMSGFQAITLRDLYLGLEYGHALPAKPVIITFDDGYQDNYTEALPVLKSFGDKATFFIISGLVGGSDYMDWGELMAAHDQGIEIGSHSVTHPDLAVVRDGRLDWELQESKALIEANLRSPVYFFAYPSGKFDAVTEARAHAAGYLMAVTTNPGVHERNDQLLEIPRIRVSGGEPLQRFIEAVETP